MRRVLGQRWPLRSVRWQVILPFAAVVVLISALGGYVVTNLLQGSLESRFVGHLVESSRVAGESLVRRERAHLEVTRSIAYTTGLPEALHTAPERLESMVQPLAANRGVERVELVGPDGVVRYGITLSATTSAGYERIGASERSLPALDRVLTGAADEKGDKHVDLAELDGEYWIVTVAPIRDGAQLRGAVLVGTRLTTTLSAARAEAFADITAFSLNGSVLASTSQARLEGNGGAPARPPGSLATLAFGERAYRELHSELILRGQPAGSLGTALPADFVGEAIHGARWRLSLLLLGGLLFTMLVGSRVAFQLTGGLQRLVGTSRSVAAGDLSARANLRRSDEIGELGEALDQMTQALLNQHLGALASLVSAIDARDPYTRGHSLRVGHLAARIGVQMGLSPAQQHHLRVGGYLHDIGKIGIRDDVLLKPGRLTAEERGAIRRHPVIGHEIVGAVGLAPEVLAGVVLHHERLNGSGYPFGLAGDAIPLEPRVIMVADFYDALVTDRPYRAGIPREEALETLDWEVSRGRIDGAVVEALRQVAPGWDEVWRQNANLNGFDLDRPAMDPAMFSRLAA